MEIRAAGRINVSNNFFHTLGGRVLTYLIDKISENYRDRLGVEC
jgi:hypothetical protein